MNVMELKNAENSPSAETNFDQANVDSANELNEPRWSVVSFERRAASGLTYEQAAEKLAQLIREKVSGLCIITDEAARRIIS